MKRTCLDLGMCQSRCPRCIDCEHNFAPGVIEGPFVSARRSSLRRSAVLAFRLAVLLLVLALLVIVMGWLQ